VALAPTFGKAHARLGQALYFLKEYPGAVAAYEDAIRYEPDNQVTRTYLEKAKSKMEKHARKGRGEEMSVMTGDSTQFTAMNSIATDPNRSANIVTSGYRGQSNAILNAAAGPKSPTAYSNGNSNGNSNGSSNGNGNSNGNSNSNGDSMQVDYNSKDPDFDEALRIQLRANKFLANKQYKAAIEEYTAALFLVPDDPNLSPDLHMGRAHALNGSRRHESARNDAILAIRSNPSPAAFSTLAKSLFYMKNHRGSVEAFRQCQNLLPRGEYLGMFDKAYLQKAEAALEEEEASLRAAGRPAPSPQQVVPKLAPPRFVPREQAINTTPSLPPMPKEWPQQSPRSPTAFKCGPEREVVFISESLGIKLNRGSDGLVRVLSVSANTPASPVARNGRIEIGDVVREVVGVDIRRPITNIMWGDTVALIKMAPRPIVLIVAEETSEVPPAVVEELHRAASTPTGQAASVFRPSPSSGDGSTPKDLVINTEQGAVSPVTLTNSGLPDAAAVDNSLNDAMNNTTITTEVESPSAEVVIPSLFDEEEEKDTGEDEEEEEDGRKEDTAVEASALDDPNVGEVLQSLEPTPTSLESKDDDVGIENPVSISSELEDLCVETPIDVSAELVENPALVDGGAVVQQAEVAEGKCASIDTRPVPVQDTSQSDATMEGSLRDKEDRLVEGEILFLRSAPAAYNGWDSLRWMSYSGVRKIVLCQAVVRQVEAEKKTLFWTTVGTQFAKRRLLIYEKPNVILVVRSPEPGEIATLLDLSDKAEIAEAEKDIESYHVVESVIEPQTCKLRLSPLTTVTSLAPEGANPRRRSCFELITPIENVIISAVRKRDDVKKTERSFTDSGAFLETLPVESAIAKVICGAHEREEDVGKLDTGIMWKHQLILGTLHSHVLSGKQKVLEQAIQHVISTIKDDNDTNVSLGPGQLPSKIIDARDDNGYTALYYACSQRMAAAVALLVKAGADVTFKTHPNGLTPCHICAQNLDDKSLSTVLAATRPARPDPNVLDVFERTPMQVAVLEGHTASGGRDSVALEKCIVALEAWGGQIVIPGMGFQRPVSFLAAAWRPEDLSVVLRHMHYRYPLKSGDVLDDTSPEESLSAHFCYPLHSCLVSMRREIDSASGGETHMEMESSLIRTVRVLFQHGFDPNERLEQPEEGAFRDDPELGEFVGYTPMQVVASIALEFEATKSTMPTELYVRTRNTVADAAELLVRNGARTSVDVPPNKRLRRKKSVSKSSITTSSQDEEVSEGSSLKLDSKQIIALLGGEDRLGPAKKEWGTLKAVNATGMVSLLTDDKETISDSDAAGGSSEKSCAICWKTFGLLNRKHRCRVMRRHVCDDCSTKRLIQGGVEYRISDGQFLLAAVDAGNEASERLQAKSEQDRIQGLQAQKSQAALRLERLEAEEKVNRDSLFGGVMEQAANYVFGEDEDSSKRPARQAEGLAASLGQTRDALNERGEKLNSLNEKSAQLVDSSSEFARMAKELRRKSEAQSKWFG